MMRQIERLRPHQIDAALAVRSLIYLPLGTIEWHCHHLPVGLDALTAHGLCLAAAEKTGGLVWPVLYYGTGGGHGAFPWTVMMPTGDEIDALLRFTLRRLSALGVAEAVLFSGHFADEQLVMIDQLAADWNSQGHPPLLRAMAVNRAGIADFPPDHAGLFETALLQGIDAGLVDLAQLGSGADDKDRFDPASTLWGIVGADPRQTAPLSAGDLAARLTDWLVKNVRAVTPQHFRAGSALKGHISVRTWPS
jgi:creatinine amidohydrolase